MIHGAKGGGAQSHTPTEAPDSLRSIAYARTLDAISEGPIEGPALGTDHLAQCVFLNETPIQNDDGSYNFQGVQLDSRSGTQTQDYLPGFPEVENSIGVGVELRSGTPWTQALSDTNLSAVSILMSLPAGLQQSDSGTGDITGYSIGYVIELSTDGAAYETVLTGRFSGKASSNYQRSHRLDLPPATTGWSVRVTRTTVNLDSALTADTTRIESYTEIIDAKLRYPNTALVGTVVDASQFQSVPTRSFWLKGRIIRVPSNYDPVARTYSGSWDGTFVLAYSNNPAWVFYDLATHTRYGLGNLLTDAQLNKWALYQIGQYCDGSVSDGKGGTEPRFTCNLYLQSQADALKVLRDLASVFRGMAYYAAGTINAVADMPADPAYTYNQANVVDGRFTYQGSGRKTRFTVALVSWNDPSDFYRAKVEYVEDPDGIARYGIQQTQVTAIGCSSQGMARRLGIWTLYTSRLETETVTFSLGLDGTFCAPGSIVRIADPNRMRKRVSGRISVDPTATVITVDADVDASIGDTLSVNGPDGVSQSRTVTGVGGRTLTVGTAFDPAPQPQSAWLIESSELVAPTYRILAVTEGDGISFPVTALRHVADKFSGIDDGELTTIQLPPTVIVTPNAQPAPASVTITGHQVVEQGISITVMTIEAAATAHAVAYRFQWQRDNGDWVDAGTSASTSIDVRNVRPGTYVARVTAVNASNVASLPAYSTVVTVSGKVTAPLPPTLTATGGQLEIVLKWTWPDGIIIDDTSYTEIWVSETSTFADGHSQGTYAYPINTVTITGLLPDKQLWFWARLVDKSQNVGAWSSPPATAVGGDVTDLFAPVQDQLDTILKEYFPLFAGDPSAAAASDAVLAGVWSQVTNRQDADSALEQTVQLIGAKTPDGQAFILNANTVKVTPTQSLAQKLDTVAVDLGPLEASVTTLASAQVSTQGQLDASYTLDISVDGYVSGFVAQNTGDVSNFVIVADNFQIVKPTGGARTEFSSGNWRVYDASGTLRVRLGVW